MKVFFSLVTAMIVTFGYAQSTYDNFDDVRSVTYGLNVPFPEQQNNGIGGTEWPGWHGTLVQQAENPDITGIN
ncbi:MAG: hypothetical protein HRT74_09685, partial [Flavobacteriales bacterium]|nr:hypothetical protein [Flavobacteriales bacterium]